jgi:hypothetical protein
MIVTMGLLADGVFAPDTWVLDLASMAWTAAEVSPGVAAPRARETPACAMIGARMLLHGGARESAAEFMDSAWILELSF